MPSRHSEPGVSSAALSAAIADFKALNRRSDVQASGVQITLKHGDFSYKVPSEIWQAYFKEQAHWGGWEQGQLDKLLNAED